MQIHSPAKKASNYADPNPLTLNSVILVMMTTNNKKTTGAVLCNKFHFLGHIAKSFPLGYTSGSTKRLLLFSVCQFLVTLVLLYQQVGLSFLVGLAFTILGRSGPFTHPLIISSLGDSGVLRIFFFGGGGGALRPEQN